MEGIQTALFSMQDLGYRDFHAALLPAIDRETIIGVRLPNLRRFAKQLLQRGDCAAFLAALPHRYYEENMLHALLLSMNGGPFDEVLDQIEAFLPHVDNWAVCDSFSPRAFDRDPARAYALCLRYLDSGAPYTVRFALVTLLKRFLDAPYFDPALLPRLAGLSTGEYYVNMAVAWYLAEALAKQYSAVLPAFETRLFSPWVHNKAIQKAVESYRIPPEHKAYLRSLRMPAARRGKAGL